MKQICFSSVIKNEEEKNHFIPHRPCKCNFLGGGVILKFKENKLLLKEQQESVLSFFLEDSKVEEIPSKDSGYYFDRDKSNCTNEAQVEWDSISWSPKIKMSKENKERVSCQLYFSKTYHEGILNGTDLVLKDDLIPITLEDDGTVRKADLTTPWYSYADKKWANAVILQNSYDALSTEGKVVGATKKSDYVSFDGVDDNIDLGFENYDFENQLTISVKLKLNRVVSNVAQCLLGNWEAAGGGIFAFGNEFQYEFYDANSSIIKRYLLVY